MTELAAQLGVSEVTLRLGLSRYYGAAYHAISKIRQYDSRHRPSTYAIDWPQAMQDYRDGATHQEIGDQYGCSEFAVRSGLNERYGDEHRAIARQRRGQGRRRADVDWDAVWAEVQAGALSPQLEVKYGIAAGTIRGKLKQLFGQAYHDRVRGNRGRNNLLSDLDWDAIWAEVQAGAFSPALGPKYGVSEVTIRHGLAARFGQAYHDRVRGNRGGYQGEPTLLGESAREKKLRLPPLPRGSVIGKLYAGGASYEQLADLLGMSRGSIHNILPRYPEYRDEYERRQERAALIRELHDQGWLPADIAEVIGRGDGQSIAKWLEVRGLIPNTVRRRVRPMKLVKPPRLRDRRP